MKLPLATLLVVAAFALNCSGQTATPKPKSNSKQATSPISKELAQCRILLNHWGDSSFSLDGLNTEGLITTSVQLESCVRDQGTALSKTDLLTAYKLLGDLSAAEMKLLSNIITDTEKVCGTQKDAAITAGEIIANESNQYNTLITRYNTLVVEYNRLLADYNSYAAEESNFLATIQSELSSISRSYNWSPPAPPEVTYQAPTRTQINCTTQTMQPAAPGLSAWSYTNCY